MPCASARQAAANSAGETKDVGPLSCHPRLRRYSSPASAKPEGWPSGLRRSLGKRVYGKPYRGFESHSLRQSLLSNHSPKPQLSGKACCRGHSPRRPLYFRDGRYGQKRSPRTYFLQSFILLAKDTVRAKARTSAFSRTAKRARVRKAFAWSSQIANGLGAPPERRCL